MSSVVIEGGWAPSGRHLRRTGTSSFEDTTSSSPPFSRPAFGYPDFVVSAKRRRSLRRRRHRRMAVAALVGAVVAGAGWVVASNDIGTHDALSQARNALAHTRAQLSQTASQRDTYRAQLRQAESQLAQAQGQITVQGGQMTVLKTCLGGVLSSLSYASNGDYTDAIATIDGVANACNSASSLVAGGQPVTGAPASSPPAATTTA